jgi:hypothetical protein
MLHTSVPAKLSHVRPVERNRLFVARSTQLEIPLAGLVPVIHAFPAVHKATFEAVGGLDQIRPRGNYRLAPRLNPPLFSGGETTPLAQCAKRTPADETLAHSGDFAYLV